MLPLTSVSPREAYLERRVLDLEMENKYLRSRVDLPRYSILAPAEIIAQPIMQQSIHLSCVGMAEVERQAGPFGYHVLVREMGRGGPMFKLGYFVSDEALEDTRDRATLMHYLNERALEQIAPAFFR